MFPNSRYANSLYLGQKQVQVQADTMMCRPPKCAIFLSLLLYHVSSFDIGGLLRGGGLSVPAAKRPIAAAENGNSDYPWQFEGRLWFRPALVRVTSDSDRPPPSVSILSIFGWTLGGVVALEYDDSPVGPYREYVTMGAVVSKRGGVGQWGSSLYVSTDVAQRVCEDVWGVPAELADIDFADGGGEAKTTQCLRVESAPGVESADVARERIEVRGWGSTRVLPDAAAGGEPKRFPSGGLPVLWTPTIKALWAPLIPLPPSSPDRVSSGDGRGSLPLHKLRLSAGALRLRLCGQEPSNSLGIPLGVGLIVDNVLIEISRQDGAL